MIKDIRLSIIIPTRNRYNSLIKTLESICQQNLKVTDFEVIVIDNGSVDKTNEIQNQYTGKFNHFIYFYDDTPGLLTGRHKGAELSSGDILSFIDDDVELNNNWLNAVKETLDKNADIHFVTGPCLPKYESYPPEWINAFEQSTPYGGTMCTWLSLIDLGDKEIIVDATYVFGLNFSIRKKSFLELGGFHPDCIPSHLQKFQGDGETGLSIKGNEKGYTALYSPKVMLYHLVPKEKMTVNYFEKRAFYNGVCDSYTFLRKRIDSRKNISDKVVIKPFRPKLWNRALNALSKIEIANNLPKKLNTIPEETGELKKRLELKYSEGFAFHQQAFNTNEKVRKWVLKPNYWNYKLPEND